MSDLTLWSLLRYLTQIGDWRDQDFVARNIVKIVKQEPFNGYFEVTIGGVSHRFDQNNGQSFLPYLYRALAKKIGPLIEGDFSLVPIPNSDAVVGDISSFPTLDHARGTAAAIGSRSRAVGALRWKQAKEKAHQGGGRNPDAHFDNLEIVERPQGAIVLFDDVRTTGSQLIGAYRRLYWEGIEPAFAVVVGRTTHEQHDKMLAWEQEQLATEPARIDLNAFLNSPL